MARRKPAPRYQRGIYTKFAAHTGGREEVVKIIDMRLIEISLDGIKGAIGDWLYTIEKPAQGVFGTSRTFAYECELRKLDTRLMSETRKAA